MTQGCMQFWHWDASVKANHTCAWSWWAWFHQSSAVHRQRGHDFCLYKSFFAWYQSVIVEILGNFDDTQAFLCFEIDRLEATPPFGLMDLLNANGALMATSRALIVRFAPVLLSWLAPNQLLWLFIRPGNSEWLSGTVLMNMSLYGLALYMLSFCKGIWAFIFLPKKPWYRRAGVLRSCLS